MTAPTPFCCLNGKTYLLSQIFIDCILNRVSPVAQWLTICLQCRSRRRHRFNPWVWKIPWRRAWQPVPVLLPGESHSQRNLASYTPWGHKESDTIEQLTLLFHFAWRYSFFIVIPKYYFIIWLYHNLFTHSCVDGYLVWGHYKEWYFEYSSRSI